MSFDPLVSPGHKDWSDSYNTVNITENETKDFEQDNLVNTFSYSTNNNKIKQMQPSLQNSSGVQNNSSNLQKKKHVMFKPQGPPLHYREKQKPHLKNRVNNSLDVENGLLPNYHSDISTSQPKPSTPYRAGIINNNRLTPTSRIPKEILQHHFDSLYRDRKRDAVEGWQSECITKQITNVLSQRQLINNQIQNIEINSKNDKNQFHNNNIKNNEINSSSSSSSSSNPSYQPPFQKDHNPLPSSLPLPVPLPSSTPSSSSSSSSSFSQLSLQPTKQQKEQIQRRLFARVESVFFPPRSWTDKENIKNTQILQRTPKIFKEFENEMKEPSIDCLFDEKELENARREREEEKKRKEMEKKEKEQEQEEQEEEEEEEEENLKEKNEIENEEKRKLKENEDFQKGLEKKEKREILTKKKKIENEKEKKEKRENKNYLNSENKSKGCINNYHEIIIIEDDDEEEEEKREEGLKKELVKGKLKGKGKKEKRNNNNNNNNNNSVIKGREIQRCEENSKKIHICFTLDENFDLDQPG